jgi:hypothetical protein
VIDAVAPVAYLMVARDGVQSLHFDRDDAARQAIRHNGVIEALVRESSLSAMLMESFREGIAAERERARIAATLPPAAPQGAEYD